MPLFAGLPPSSTRAAVIGDGLRRLVDVLGALEPAAARWDGRLERVLPIVVAALERLPRLRERLPVLAPALFGASLSLAAAIVAAEIGAAAEQAGRRGEIAGTGTAAVPRDVGGGTSIVVPEADAPAIGCGPRPAGP